MNAKKLVGAFTALVMTLTVFAGFASTAGAVDNAVEKYNIKYVWDNNTVKTQDDAGKDIYSQVSKPDYVFTVEEGEYSGKYIVVEADQQLSGYSFENNMLTLTYDCTVTVDKLQSVNITIDGAGTVAVDGTSFKNGGVFSAAAGTSHTVVVTAGENSYIKTASLSDDTSWSRSETIATAAFVMPENDTDLKVEFGSYYSVEAAGNVSGGSVSLSVSTAKAGDKVTVYTIPDDGYKLKQVTAVYGDAQMSIDVTSAGNTHTFIMPEGNVAVTAEFEQIVVPPADVSATFINDYTEGSGKPASLWEGTLTGQGFAYMPSVSVRLNDGSKKTAVCSTTVDGSSNITSAVIVDKVSSDIEEVRLKGSEQSADADSSFNLMDDKEQTGEDE